MAKIQPTFIRGQVLVNWNSGDGVNGDLVTDCMTDGDTTTLCVQVGLGDNDCLKVSVPGLLSAVPGDFLILSWIARMSFGSFNISPYSAAFNITTTNALGVGAAPGNSPATIVLTQAWIDDLFDFGSGTGAFRIVENLATPIAGNASVTELEVHLGPDAPPLMWGRAF